MSNTRVSPVSFLKLSADVASFYGFRNVRDIERSLKRREPPALRGAPSFMAAAHLSAVKASLSPLEPVLAFYATPSPAYLPPGTSAREVGEFGLSVVGVQESVGEIIILKTISAIAAEWGAPIARVRL